VENPRDVLPADRTAKLVGRIWDPTTGGPRIVAVRGDLVVDVTDQAPTMADLIERADAALFVERAAGREWILADLVDASLDEDPGRARMLAPIDLQVVKACGVTFAESLIERVIEERSGGDASRAAEIRESVMTTIGGEISELRPGSPEAARAKAELVELGMWSQYLEVGIGPDPEVFTKAPVLSSVGFGSRIGIPSFSSWNNPEPELVLIADSAGAARGATLGNDVNLRDIEGRSALLLGMAKDNNASSAIGPFIRLFTEDFTMDDLATEEIALEVQGEDGFVLRGRNTLANISRPFSELLGAVRGSHHQYPDGFALYTGTLFAPSQDRDVPGGGFTHKPGDVVTISSQRLGRLINVVGTTEDLPEWSFGIRALYRYLLDLGRDGM
jgi:fumarylacetoacetate (FAA) hydrolase family protein